MKTMRKEVILFSAACEELMDNLFHPADLNEYEAQTIQYYVSALSGKFPAVSN